MTGISLVFPHQLFEVNPAIEKGRPVYLVEEALFFKQYPFHKQKIAFHRATMKAYQAYLEKKGFQVNYIEANEPQADVRQLIHALHKKGTKEIHVTEVSDDWLNQRISNKCKKYNIQFIQYKSPLFLT